MNQLVKERKQRQQAFFIEQAYNAGHPLVQIHHSIGVMNWEVNELASRTLSGDAYKLYMYFIRLPNDAVWILNPNTICKNTGIDVKKINECMRELDECNYIVSNEIEYQGRIFTNKCWHFFEY